MKCLECHTENPDTRKFCRECGNKLLLLCPACTSENIPGDKFCGDCGAPLVQTKTTQKELSFEDKVDKIQRYLPKGLTDKILSQRGKIEGERKQVTVMFCDLEDFTPLVGKLGTEDAYHMMDKIYEILIHKVHDFEGTVNEMTGDGIMALFGAPLAVEDAPQRAIRSAMAIHEEIKTFTNENIINLKNLPPLCMRIGIHTGPVVVGTLGNNLRVEFKAVGDTVNLASRMENLAEPGTTFVSEQTYKLTEGFFQYDALGERNIKGIKAPVKTYRVIAPKSKITRFDVSAERGLTRFVGRQKELELLLDGFERSRKGFGNAFSIVSEAGAGKSRLLYEFRKSVANESITFLEGKCLSFSKNIAYHPIIELIKETFRLEDNDTDHDKIQKVKKGLRNLGVHEETVLVYVLELLSVEDSGFVNTSMSPESKKDRTIEALRLIILKVSEQQPLILAFEDLHWIDKNSEDCLKDLLDSVSGSNIFLVLTYRPEYRTAWDSRSYHSQINLNRLSNRESLLIASYLLHTESIHKNLEEWILSKTEGIPFFIEEFIKYLRDMNTIVEKNSRSYLNEDIKMLSVPSSIQDIISARVDTLNEYCKLVLQVGSTFERDFSYQLIEQVTGFENVRLMEILNILKKSELIIERGIAPESVYIFRHALIRDVIYGSILRKRKKRLHEQIGNAIESLYSEQLVEYYEILAEHYSLSENYEKAATYSKFAGKMASRAVSFTNAITFTEKWVASLENLPPSKTVEKQLIDARATLGFHYLQMEQYGSAHKAIKPVIELAEKKNYKKGLANIYTLRGAYEFFVREEISTANDYLKKAIRLSEETGNFISLIFSNHFLGHVCVDTCEFERGHHFINKALEIVEMGNVLWSIAMHKACIAFTVFGMQNKIDLAYQSGIEAIQLAEKSGDILSKAEAYTNSGACCCYKGSLKEAENYLLIGTQVSKKANLDGHGFSANFNLGEVYYFLGNYNKAREYLLKAVSIEGKGVLGASYINLAKITLAAVKINENEKDIDFDVLRTYISENKIKRIEGRFRRYFCIILINYYETPSQEAKEMIEQAIAVDQKNNLPYELGMDHYVYAEFFKRKGNILKARDKLDIALERYKKCGADGWVKRVEKDLADL